MKNKGKNFKTSMQVKNVVYLNKIIGKIKRRRGAKVFFKDITHGKGIEDLGILIFSDGSLLNTEKSKSQIGCVAMLVGNSRKRKYVAPGELKAKTGHENFPIIEACPILWRSQKSPRVANSSGSAETQALYMTTDTACTLRSLLGELLFGSPLRKMEIDVRGDNINTIRAVHMLGTVSTDKRMQGIIESLKEMIRFEDVNSISYVPGTVNIADEMTKSTSGKMIYDLATLNEIRVPSEEVMWNKWSKTHNSKQFLLMEHRYKELDAY